MRKDEKIDVYVNHLRALYLELRSGGIANKEDILKNDITPIMWAGFLKSIEQGELINWSIRGKTGSSKSTIGCKLKYKATIHMIQKKMVTVKQQELQNYIYESICSDQTEFIRYAMKRTTREPTIALIDEFSTMGETGFNATTEQAMYKEHSDLFAQEKLHKISCSPTYINDRNADIILDVVGTNKEKKITRVIVNYRDTTEWIIFPLGYADIYVGDIIEMEFYRRYRIKKFKRLDLLKKHGIKNVKELEFSIITKEVYDVMKDTAYIKKQTQDVILGVVEAIRRKLKMQYSILTLNFVIMKVKGMLDLVSEIAALKRTLEKKKKTEETEKIIKQGIEKYGILLNMMIEEEINKIKIEKEYREIT